MLKVDVRVIAATNRDLDRGGRAGRFRGDLFHRLSVFPLHVPPLRERRDDVALLGGYFLDVARPARPRPAPPHAEARARLHDHAWPGNVRELEHTLLRAALRASDGRRRETVVIDPEDLGLDEVDDSPPRPGPPRRSRPEPRRRPSRTPAPRPPSRPRRPSSPRGSLSPWSSRHGNWAAAARALGVHRTNLHRLARRLGLR